MSQVPAPPDADEASRMIADRAQLETVEAPLPPREIVDFPTSLFQNCGSRLYRLLPKTTARQVRLGDSSVEARILNLESAVAGNTTTRFARDIAGMNALAAAIPGDRCLVEDAGNGPVMFMKMPDGTWKDTSLPLNFRLGDILAPDGGLVLDEDGRVAVNPLPADIRELAARALNDAAGAANLAQEASWNAQEAATAADSAIGASGAAARVASEALAQADNAGQIAADAQNRASAALETSSEALNQAAMATATANDAGQLAQASRATAESALEASTGAMNTAGAANVTANTAADRADEARRTANTASASATLALEQAADAVATADAAGEMASQANLAAGNAALEAAGALDAALAAQNRASAASEAANAAANAASTAQNTASAAASNASSALSAASAAQDAASQAANAAAGAQKDASSALALCVPMTGATTTANGRTGLVPGPAAGPASRYLRSDGTWSTPPDTNTTYGAASQSTAGLMSAADKKKLDGIAAGATNTAAPPAAATATPQAHGTAAVGTSARYAREDHVHPSNNTDTHWTSHLYAGTASGNANAATTNGGTNLVLCDNSTVRNRVALKGAGATSVSSDASGNVTITSTNTTYGAATQSANGLMSAADKKKLDGLDDSNLVHKTGAEYITGTKAFGAVPWFSGNNESFTRDRIIIKDPVYAQGNGNAANSQNNIAFLDSNAISIGNIYSAHDTDMRTEVVLHTCGTTSSGEFVNNRLCCTVFRNSGYQYIWTDGGTPVGAASNELATAMWVRNLLASAATASVLGADIPVEVVETVSASEASRREALAAGGISALDLAEDAEAGLASFEVMDSFLEPCALADAMAATDGQPAAGSMPVTLRRALTEAEKFTSLRTERNLRLMACDAAISRLQRLQRIASRQNDDQKVRNLEARMADWDDYADALCLLPGQPGAPWDGGGSNTPWPAVPGAGEVED